MPQFEVTGHEFILLSTVIVQAEQLKQRLRPLEEAITTEVVAIAERQDIELPPQFRVEAQRDRIVVTWEPVVKGPSEKRRRVDGGSKDKLALPAE